MVGGQQLRQRTKGRDLKFPGRSFRDSHVCVVMLRVIRLILENLEMGTNITTRDIYYQDVELFCSQDRVSAAIERLCLNTGVPRSLFKIMPSPKGLIVADLEVTLKEAAEGHGTKTILSRCNGIALIPVGQEILHLAIPKDARRPKYVLIVEKEGVFSHLYSSLPEAIIITGKGFPDHYTRKFVYAIYRNFPDLPIYGLVDSDVHGIQILRTYQNSGENTLEFHYPLEKIQFLGVSIYDYVDGWVDITTREYKLIMSMLQKDWIRDDAHTLWRREVQRQMFMGKKVEMNILDRSHLNTLVKYIRSKVEALHSANIQTELFRKKQEHRYSDTSDIFVPSEKPSGGKERELAKFGTVVEKRSSRAERAIRREMASQERIYKVIMEQSKANDNPTVDTINKEGEPSATSHPPPIHPEHAVYEKQTQGQLCLPLLPVSDPYIVAEEPKAVDSNSGAKSSHGTPDIATTTNGPTGGDITPDKSTTKVEYTPLRTENSSGKQGGSRVLPPERLRHSQRILLRSKSRHVPQNSSSTKIQRQDSHKSSSLARRVPATKRTQNEQKSEGSSSLESQEDTLVDEDINSFDCQATLDDKLGSCAIPLRRSKRARVRPSSYALGTH